MTFEERLFRWQLVSHACIHAGKPIGGAWNINITGTCPITQKEIRIVAIGKNPSFISCFDELEKALGPHLQLPAVEKILAGLSHPALTKK